jgi:hypothetical protein
MTYPNPTTTKRGNHAMRKILSASRVLDGVSENASSILAIDSPDHRRRETAGEIVDDSPAQSVRTSRRVFMNSVVSAASLVAATKIVPAAVLQVEDPIFAAIERYRKGLAAFIVQCERENEAVSDDYQTPEMVAAVDENIHSRMKLAATMPTTPAGLSALMDFVVTQSEAEGTFIFEDDCEPHESELYAFMETLARAVRGMAGLRPVSLSAQKALDAPTLEVDPIFAAIARHAETVTKFNEAVRARNDLQDALPLDRCQSMITVHGRDIVETDDPRFIEWEIKVDATSDEMGDAAVQFLQVEPTSLQGAAALLRYVVDHFDESGGVLVGFPDDLLTDQLDPELNRDQQARSTEYWLMKNVAASLARLSA